MRLALAAVCALAAVLAASSSALAADPTLSGSFDGSGTPAGSMTPQRMAINESTGYVYVIDSAHDVIDVFTAGGTYQSQIPGSSTTNGSFSFGGDDDVAIDNSGGMHEGNVYVNSETAGLIFAFDSSGSFLWQSNTNVSDTCGVAVDAGGNPWMADFTNGLQKLDPANGAGVGSPLLATGDSCHFALDSTGRIILNHWNASVDRYNADGTLDVRLEQQGTYDVAVDSSNDNVYADRIVSATIWDTAGNQVGSSFGLVDLRSSSTGIAVNGETAKIYLSDPGVGTVLTYDGTVQRRLNVTVDDRLSGGSVTADSGAISSCTSSSGTCSGIYDLGTTVTLTATPDAGSGVAWSGCDSVAGNDCTITVTAVATVAATFAPLHDLTVSKDGTGSGSVSSSPAGIDCGATCRATLLQGDVTLTATPDAGSTFAGWSGGGCSGTGTCQVNLTADTTVTATFAQKPPAVTTGAASGVTETGATVAGTVNPNGANVTDCHVDYGTTTAYGSQAACASLPGSGMSAVDVSASLSGLVAGTTYHYRVVATNAGGTANGDDATFTTSSPTCETDASLCTSSLRLLRAVTVLHGRRVAVRLKCTGVATCAELVRLKAKLTVGKRGHKHRKLVVIARKRVTIAAGSSVRVRFALTKAARRQLARRRALAASLTAGSYRHKLVIKAPRKKHRR